MRPGSAISFRFPFSHLVSMPRCVGQLLTGREKLKRHPVQRGVVPGGWLVCLALLLSALSVARADDLLVRVTDPQSAAVNQARITLYPAQGSGPIAVRISAGQGTASFQGLAAGRYRLEVLAAGFAARTLSVTLPENEAVVCQLSLGPVAETVEVSAARTPLPNQDTSTSVSQLGSSGLTVMQPVTLAEALRVLPGATIENSGRNGSLASLFVRGGDSRYNKVIIDDVPVNDPGGTFDFGVVPTDEIERLEFARGAASTLYGSDAMTSVVQVWTRNGTTRVPEIRFGADGGTFETAHGYASVAGARGVFDYNLFGDQFNTNGQGINDEYSNSSQGGNIGVQIAPSTFFRLRARHSNNRTGVQSFWNFNGQPYIPPDSDQFARQNNFLGSAELTFVTPSRLQNRIVAFEYNHKRNNVDSVMDPGRDAPFLGMSFSFDLPFSDFANINRAGMDYQGDYSVREWAQTTFGYHFEDENGWVGDRVAGTNTHGLRRNHAVFGQQILRWKRASVIGGIRYEHNESFGDKAVPRINASFLVARGGQVFSGTRLRGGYSTGIKEPRFEESFGIGGFNILPNPNLKAEENRAVEAGFEQLLFAGKASFSATYFNNRFRNQIDFITLNPVTFESQYINVNKSLAHGAEMVLSAQPTSRLHFEGGYTYLSTQILEEPLCGSFCNPLKAPGSPLVRRPKHSGSLLATWTSLRWGASVTGSFVGRRADSDFMGLQPLVDHAAGYARVDLGFWRAISHRVTGYVNVGNLLNRHYEEVAGYPAMRMNFRAGVRFRFGGE
jgi:vitamin B12 transporter